VYLKRQSKKKKKTNRKEMDKLQEVYRRPIWEEEVGKHKYTENNTRKSNGLTLEPKTKGICETAKK